MFPTLYSSIICLNEHCSATSDITSIVTSRKLNLLEIVERMDNGHTFGHILLRYSCEDIIVYFKFEKEVVTFNLKLHFEFDYHVHCHIYIMHKYKGTHSLAITLAKKIWVNHKFKTSQP